MDSSQLKKALLGNVVIAGAGASGLAAFEFIAGLSPQQLAIVDDGSISSDLKERLRKVRPHALIVEDGIPAELLVKADLIVLSPGIPLRGAAMKAAQAHGVLIVNEIEVAAAFLPNCTFIGITGSNGKSTVTAILGSIVTEYCANTFVGGNLGRPLCAALLAHESPAFAILELSSFQLEVITQLKLEAALVTNLAPDHLDRYDSVVDYYHAKGRILELVNTTGTVLFGTEENLTSQLGTTKSSAPLNTFCSDAHIDGDRLTYISAVTTQHFITVPHHLLHSAHNVENLKLVIRTAVFLKIPIQEIEAGLARFKALPHRFETLGFIDGVQWINDSKATNIDATIAALKGFGSVVHLILGGLGKHNDYLQLAEATKHALRHVYAVGRDGPEIQQVFSPFCPTIHSETIDRAVQSAMERAQPGDILLLSPACASYDQFKNYLERGEFFRSLYSKHSISSSHEALSVC